LLNQPLPHVVMLDGALLDDARHTFSRLSLAQRIWQVIRRSPEATALPPWNPAEAAGVAGSTMFTRRSGARLSEGLPGLYTVAAFYQVVSPLMPRALNKVANDSWVLGKQLEFGVLSPQAATLQNDVVKLYTDEYATNWDGFLADLDLAPLTNSQQSASVLYILSSPESPMRDMLTAIARQLTLSPPKSPTSAGALTDNTETELQALLGARGKAIEQHYDALIKFVGKSPGAPIDSVLKILGDLQKAADRANNPTLGGGAANALEQLRTQTAQAPEPARRWMQTILESFNQIAPRAKSDR
jgi:type VI secretion system protein ImpL